MKRMTILAATVLPLLVLNACAPVTKSLYSEISQKEYKDYTENVSQILVASNGSKVVVLGSEYHYIIDTPPGLVAVLDSPLHPKVQAQMDQFKVTPTADMTGSRNGICLFRARLETIDKGDVPFVAPPNFALVGMKGWPAITAAAAAISTPVKCSNI